MRRNAVIVLVLSLVFAAAASAQQSRSDIELWSYIQRQSPQWYAGYLQSNGVVDPGPWRQPLESAFLKLADNSGEKGFSINYSVAARDDFNAMCFPGGQFVVHAGALATFDAMIASREGVPPDRIPADRLRRLREAYIAPVLAHELGHYYNRHSFRSMKAQWSMAEMSRADLDLSQLRFSQENEFEADETGFLLLKRAGYDPNSMFVILELLNAMRQGQLTGAEGTALNDYLVTHPSPHKRLAALENDPEGLNRWAAGLEQAFSDIQLGMNLEAAVDTIRDGLLRAPGNLPLRKAEAVALHKIWLATTTLEQQKLKGQIDMPAFRDEMVFSRFGARAVRKTIPGDRMKYMRAREAYGRIYEKTTDPGFYSNYALLLAYSPEAADEQMARDLAFMAVRASSTASNVSNFGVVMYLTGDRESAMAIFSNIAGTIDSNLQAAFVAAELDPMAAEGLAMMYRRMERVQALDADYVQSDFVPLLNLALCLSMEGDDDGARNAASLYLNSYEATSAWASHLAGETGVDLPEDPFPSYLEVNGVSVTDTISALVDAWGSATDIASLGDGIELWFYEEEQAKVSIQDGIVAQIELVSPDSPSPGELFGIGSSRRDIESVLGSPKRTATPFDVYEGSQNAAVAYVNDIAEVLVLFP